MKKLPLYTTIAFTIFNLGAISFSAFNSSYFIPFGDYIFKLSLLIYNLFGSYIVSIIILIVFVYLIYKTRYKLSLVLIIFNMLILLLIGAYFQKLILLGSEVQDSIQLYYNKYQYLPNNLSELENYNELSKKNVDEILIYKGLTDRNDRKSFLLFIKPSLFNGIELKYNKRFNNFEIND